MDESFACCEHCDHEFRPPPHTLPCPDGCND
jgi:hypothetical protein